MSKQKSKLLQKERRRGRVRAKISGESTKPRLSVFRSNRGLYLQLIDDTTGKTLISAHSLEIKSKDKKQAIAFELGKLLAKKAQEKKIETVVFDRSGYKYHGRVKAVADGAREGGLKF